MVFGVCLADIKVEDNSGVLDPPKRPGYRLGRCLLLG